MQLPILNGIYSTDTPDLRVSYPVNLTPIATRQGISAGYMRPAEGIVAKSIGPGINRGTVNWNGLQYRVMGTKLVLVDNLGSVFTVGDVGGSDRSTLDYSFDYLGVVSDEKLYMYDGVSTITQVTDPDLGIVLDMIWVDGYFMTTDGEFVVVSDLNDPFNINPIKYGSSEADPDPVLALLKVHNEPYVLNRYTIEVFENVGGTGFPFARIEGAQVQHGTVGIHSNCVFMDSIVFVGGGRREAFSVWQVQAGNSIKLATREIELILEGYSEVELSNSVVEPRVGKGLEQIYIHLPDQTLIYDHQASKMLQDSVWYVVKTDSAGYRARDIIFLYGEWWVGDPRTNRLGVLSDDIGSHWGDDIDWEFSTTIVYNEANSVIFHELELMSLANKATTGSGSDISTQYTEDGQSWSNLVSIPVRTPSGRNKKLSWLQQGSMKGWRVQRFQGDSNARLSFIRLEAKLEAAEV